MLPNVSPDTLTLWSTLPQFVQDSDAANGYTFLLWLDGMGSQQQVIDNLCRDEGVNPGWSILMDIERCPTYALPWLAQFLGGRFTSLQTTDAQMRETILLGCGLRRGTIGHMEWVGLSFLNPGGSVVVNERTTDPYHFTVEVFGMPGYNYSQLDAAFANYNAIAAAHSDYDGFTQNIEGLTQALLSTKPAGLIMNISFVRDYNQIDAAYATYNILDAAFLTYGDIQ